MYATGSKRSGKARQAGDYAIGAVLVKGQKVIARCGNRSNRDENPAAHAETLAIILGSKVFKKRHLKNCVLYTTHEPCPMCASTIVWAKLKGVVYGTTYQDMKRYSKKFSNHQFSWRTIDISCKEIFKKSPERIEVVKNFLRKGCLKLFHNE